MGTSNKFFEWNFLPSIIIIITFPRIRISIHKFIINEEIKSELEERIVKMAGNGEISIKRDVVETRFKKEKEKERKKKTLHPCLDWISIHIELYISETEKKKKYPR